MDYKILETLNAGIVLSGQEVKSIRAGRTNLKGAFVTVSGNELWLTNTGIPAWQVKNAPQDYDEQKPRKLLLRKNEIASLIGKIKAEGLTVIPLKLYNQGQRIKVEIGVARHIGKKDRREIIKKREAERDVRRSLKSR